MAISHGWFFVALELAIVVAIVWGDARHRRNAAASGRVPGWGLPVVETLLMALVYLVFRIQPYLRGGDVFAFVLGVFDGVALASPIVFFAVHSAARSKTSA